MMIIFQFVELSTVSFSPNNSASQKESLLQRSPRAREVSTQTSSAPVFIRSQQSLEIVTLWTLS